MNEHESEHLAAGAQSADAAALRFRAMTFNILCRTASPEDWPRRRREAVALIREYEPDLLAVQDCMPEQLEDLRADLHDYAVVPGPVSGASHLPAWAAAGVPALALAGMGAWWGARRHPALRQRVGRLLGAAAVALAPTALRWVRGQEAHQEGEHCAIFLRPDRWRLAAEGAFRLSPRPDRPGSVAPGSWLSRVVNWARLRPTAGGAAVTLYNVHGDYLPVAWPTSAAVLRERLARDWDGSTTSSSAADRPPEFTG